MPVIQLPTVTALPILIESSEGAPLNGVGVLFPNKRDTVISGLHQLSKKEALGKRWDQLDEKARQIVSGIALLQAAMKEQDWEKFQYALDLIKDYFPHFGGEAEIQHIRGSKKWKEAVIVFSWLMTNLLEPARFLIWYSPDDGRPRPGLFCPNWRVALYAVVGMDRLRICEKPGCGEMFIPSDDKHTHCTTAHQNAHNQAKWKAANPEKAKKYRRPRQRVSRKGTC